MAELEDGKRTYYWPRKAWYAEKLSDDDKGEVWFGVDGGEAHGEMSMRWVDLGNRLTPYLHVYHDGWMALATFDDLLERLADLEGATISEEEFVALLEELGFEDTTTKQDPARARYLRTRLEKLETEAAHLREILEGEHGLE